MKANYKLGIVLFLLLINSTFIFAEEYITSSSKVSQQVQTKNNNGTYTFTTSVITRCDLYGGINFIIGMKDFQINSYTYQGISAASLKGASFPINTKVPQANVTMKLRFKRGTAYIDINKKFVGVHEAEWGGLERSWLDDADKEKVYNKFGITKENKKEFYNLKIELLDIHIDLSLLPDALTAYQKQIKENISVTNLKEQYNNLNDNKEDLQKKKVLAKKIYEIDNDQASYNQRINNLDEKLTSLEEAENQKAAQQSNETMATNSQKNSTSTGESNQNSTNIHTNIAKLKTAQELEQERRQKEQERRQAEYAAQMARAKQQELQMQKNTQNLKQVYNEFVPAVAEGVSSGVITHLGGTIDYY